MPVVSIGGQETALFLTRGECAREAAAPRPDLPAQGAPGLDRAAVGAQRRLDLPGRLPLPAKISIRVLPPIDLRERFGEEPDPDDVYEHVTSVMQDALDTLAEDRRLPVVG